MLDLNARVHFEKIELTGVLVEDEFHRAGVLITDGAPQGNGRVADFPPESFIDAGSRGFLDDLLVTPLQGTIALAEMNHVAEAVAEELHFDMPGILDVLFHVNGVVSKGSTGFR